MMPRLDGYQTCALIKNNQMFKHTPVIMLSSKDGLFDKARGRIVGSEQYVTKPFTREELLDAIRKHVNHRSEEHTSELQSLMRISYAVFCLKKKNYKITTNTKKKNKQNNNN